MRFFSKLAIIWALLAFGQAPAYAAATLLPNGEQCFQATTGTTGMVGLLGTITGGSGGTAGTYGGVSLTGGSGSGATANVTVAGGAVTSVTILNPGSAYVVGDTLSAAAATIGNTPGFSVPVSSVTINSSLAGGSVSFFFPNTSIFKSTWFNADQALTHQNTNPVALDANGCAIIYGTGIYRQVVKDSLGNTVWDQITTDTSFNNNTFWAGLAGGTPNVITVTDPGFNASDGSIIQFIPLATNTGATTLTPSGTGIAVSIVKDTTAGAVALTGGEIIAAGTSNVVSVLYSASQNVFHLLNTVIASASGAIAPLCGANGLTIQNSAGTPSTIIALTANTMVMVNPAGLTINRGGVSLPAINLSTGNATSTANGMDGEAPGTSQWLYVWGIDNGSAAAGLVSTSSTAPTMPSGYSYKCRLGAMFVDGAGNLFRSIQFGSWTQYKVVAGSNTAALRLIAQGPAGTYSATAPVWATPSVANFVPPTATHIQLAIPTNYKGNAAVAVQVAPNNAYGGNQNASGNAPPYDNNAATGAGLDFPLTMLLEGGTIAWANGGNGAALLAFGWKDSVNAN